MLIGNQCKDSVDLVNINSPQGYLEPSTVKDQLAVKMAKLLASELTSETMREFVKQNALKKFDEDYNFLFADAYPKLLDNVKHASFVDSVLRFYPLMQVVVPELFTVIPENWDVRNHVPEVVALPENHTPNVDTLVAAYNAKGEKHFLSTKKDPTNTVIVISENVRTKFYKRGEEPAFGRIVANGRACQCARTISEPDELNTTNYGTYFLIKQVVAIENLVAGGCSGCGDGGGGGSSGGGSTTPTCQRDGSPDASDVIGKIKYLSLDTWNRAHDWTGSGYDYRMEIEHGGANGSAVKTFAVTFYLSKLKSCDFLFWACYTVDADPSVPTLSWDRNTDGDQMQYTLVAMGNGQTSSFTQSYTTSTGLTFSVTKTRSSKDFQVSSAYVKYCDQVSGEGKEYGSGQYARFFIHR
jgi:hypothetical protein